MTKPDTYVGYYNDVQGGMTDIGKIIRDAWAFGLIPETETCQGWRLAGIEALWIKVNAVWEKYGFLVSNLPDDVKQRFLAIQEKALQHARAQGWDPEISENEA